MKVETAEKVVAVVVLVVVAMAGMACHLKVMKDKQAEWDQREAELKARVEAKGGISVEHEQNLTWCVDKPGQEAVWTNAPQTNCVCNVVDAYEVRKDGERLFTVVRQNYVQEDGRKEDTVRWYFREPNGCSAE